MNNATILRELNHVGRREDGMTEGERIVEAWRESGTTDGPKPTGRVRLCWIDYKGDEAKGRWCDPVKLGGDHNGGAWLEYEFVSRTPGKPE